MEQFLNHLLDSLGVLGPFLSAFLIVVESIIPILPLFVFITFNFYIFGAFFGFLISYALTVLGCNIAFILSRKYLKKRISLVKEKFGSKRSTRLRKKFSTIKFSSLVVIMSFPFTPAFLINILGGVSNMEHKKFLYASLISKIFMVYFWGYVGTSFIKSIENPSSLIKILIILLVAYILSKIVSKKYEIE